MAILNKSSLDIDQAGNIECGRAVGIVIFKLDVLDETTQG
jgi:hypothetical protein